jgi:colanic acid biosynthesis glycosyl transferase WcaI
MKILVYGLNYAPELVGIGKYTHEMCTWLVERGHEVKVVTSYPYYPTWKVENPYQNWRYSRESGPVEVFRCPLYVPPMPSSAKRILHHLSFALSSAPIVGRVALSFRPDILFTIAPSQATLPAALFAARISHAHAWLHIHDFEIEAAFELGILSKGWLRRAAERFEGAGLSRFDRISTISAKMLDKLRQKQIPEERLIEIRNWVDTSVIFPRSSDTDLRRELGISPQAVVVLYSGTMNLKQGLESIVYAARSLASAKPQLVFVLCGAGVWRDRLVEMCRGLANVRFIGLQPYGRLNELLATADIHVLPQRAEVADLVMPSKLTAMLASGRPVIVMADAATQLAAEIAGAGLRVPAGDADALAAGLVQLVDDGDL